MPSILEHRRAYSQNLLLSAAQIQLDQASHQFVAHASDWKSLTAVACGSFAYRLGKYFALSQGIKRAAPWVGMISEVSTFRGVRSIFSPEQTSSWFTDYIHFGSLRALGVLGKNMNPLLAHSLQDVGMVATHHLSHAMKLTSSPQGTFIQQIIYAEATNLQMIAGMGLLHSLSHGKFFVAEKTLEISTVAALSSSRVQSNRLTKNTHLPLIVRKEADWSISSAGEIAEQYSKMQRLQEDYVEFLKSQNALCSEEKIPLWKFVEALDSSPSWLKDYATTHPDLIVQKVVFAPERLARHEYESAHFLANFIHIIGSHWSLPRHSISKIGSVEGGKRIISLHWMPAQLLMEARKLIPERFPIALSINSRLATPEEVIAMMALDVRPFIISQQRNDLHTMPNTHPFIQMIHDYGHLLIMDRLTPLQRRNLFELHEAVRRIDLELPAVNSKRELEGHLLEGNFVAIHTDMFFFAFRKIDTYDPKIDFLRALKRELDKSFPSGHPQQSELWSAFEKVFGEKMKEEK